MTDTSKKAVIAKDGTVAREVAEKEFFNWLDSLGYSRSDFEDDGDLEDLKSHKEKLIKQVMDGMILFESDHIIQKLHQPLKKENGDVYLEQLKYKLDYKAHEQNSALRGMNFEKETAQATIRMAKMLTGVGTGVLGELWAKDYKLLASIVVFIQA